MLTFSNKMETGELVAWQPPPFDLMDPRVELFGNIWLA